MKTHVNVAISKAKIAHKEGKLTTYKPLLAAGADERISTSAASWGPAMRR